MKVSYRLLLVSCVCLLGIMAQQAFALEPEHRVARSYGGTKVSAGSSVVISPNALGRNYPATTTELSTHSSNIGQKDPLCRSVVNSGTVDYFVPWSTARNTAAGSINEWNSFLTMAEAGQVPNLRVGPCCYPRINPNRPCGVSYALGNRTAGAIPSANMSTSPAMGTQSAEVMSYGADGDLSADIIDVARGGFNRKETWVCLSGEWYLSSTFGGCRQNGACNSDPATGGIAGTSINALPASNRAALLCNGVDPIAVSGGRFPYPESNAAAPPYGTAGWQWRCPGQQGGTTQTCSASYNNGPMNGVCGYAMYRNIYATAPADSVLCYVGTPTAISRTSTMVASGTGTAEVITWRWGCAGVNGGASTSPSACYATSPPPPAPAVASCGTYGSASRSSGLLSFETSGGLPIAAGLCGYGTITTPVTGNGTTASPWRWVCNYAPTNTTAACTNVYTKAGVCGALNRASVPSEPNNAVNMCRTGRWYNRATTGMSANSNVWTAGTNSWTWACLGHNQSTGAISNDLCSATKCAECTGTSTQSVTKLIGGNYGSCAFPSSDGELSYTQTVTRQYGTSDKQLDVVWQGSSVGHVVVPTEVSAGYCAPCFNMVTGVSNPTLRAPSCGLTVPTSVDVSLGVVH